MQCCRPRCVFNSPKIAREAMSYYVGNTWRLESNLKEALGIMESAQRERHKLGKDLEHGGR